MTVGPQLGAFAGIAALIAAAPAHASISPYTARFDVPAQDLASALRIIGRQGKIDILFQTNTVAGRRSAAVRGTMSPLAAVRAVLGRHADLEAVSLPSGALLVRVRRSRTPPLQAPAPRNPGRNPASPAPAAPPENPEIVVTALRRPGLLRTYPGSIRVVRGREIEDSGRSSLDEVAAMVPGLNLSETGTGQRRITMRGMHSAGENSVLLYLDETPISGPSSATSDVSQMSPDIRLFDIDRIEVLRGPQGTLFGSGALGGAVRIITNRPDMHAGYGEATMAASTTRGGEPGVEYRAVANLPIVPGTLALRVVGYGGRRGGHVDNVALGIEDVDSSTTRGVRAQLRAEPAPGFDLTAALLYQSQRIDDLDGWYAMLGRDRTDTTERLPFPNDLLLGTVTGHARLGSVEFTASGSYYRWDVTRTIDSTRAAKRAMELGSYCPLFAGTGSCTQAQLDAYRNHIEAQLPLVGSQPMRVEARIGELRAATAPGEPLALTGGIFFERRADASSSGTYRAHPDTGELIEPLISTYRRTIAVDTDQFALFADLGWQLTDPLVLTLGARRYSYSKQSTAQVLETSYINGAVAGPAIARATRSHGWTGRANLAFTAAPSLLLYAQVATGFRPGGVNSVPNLPEELVEYQSDSAISYEVGFRGSILGGGITGSGSIYRTDWHNMQASARIPSFMFVSNSGAARVIGMDLDLRAELGRGTGLLLGLSLLDGRLTRDQSNSVVAAPGLKGDRIPFEPRVKIVAAFEQGLPLSPSVQARLGAEVSYTGRSYSEFRPTSVYYEKMGDFAEAALHAELSSSRWSLRFDIANLFDAAGKRRVESTVGSEQLTISLAPRTLSLTFGWKFAALQQ